MERRLHYFIPNPVTLRCFGFWNAIAVSLIVSVLFSPLLEAAMQLDTAIRINDDSDWWSGGRTLDSDDTITVQKREIAGTNFRILGIELSEAMFRQARSMLGEATLIERGDAATGRQQTCYVSGENGDRVHLVFESGEVDFTFYLFANGANWNGSEYCARSNQVSKTSSTASGLHLGQTPAQVMAILGKPSNRRENEVIYSLSVTKSVP